MRVTIVSLHAERLGGCENMLWSVLEHAPRHGLEPRVICLQDGPFVKEIRAAGIPVAVIETGRLRELGSTAAAIARLARLLHRDRPDLVVSWTAKSHVYAGPAAYASGLTERTVWWQHSIPEGHWLDRLATALPTAAVGCSSHAAAQAQRNLRPKRSTFVVHPGVDPPTGDADAGLSRQDLGVRPDRPVVTIVGRLQPWKGQDRVLEALAELRDRGVEAHLLVVGGDAYGLSPEYAERVRLLVGKLRLDDRTTLVGQVPSSLPYMAISDVIVSASHPEPFGLVLLEGMMAGATVLAVDAGGPQEIVEHGRSGWLVADGRSDTIAAGLERLLGDEELRVRLSAAGRRRARQLFSAAAMTDRLSQALEALAAPRAEPPARAHRPR